MRCIGVLGATAVVLVAVAPVSSAAGQRADAALLSSTPGARIAQPLKPAAEEAVCTSPVPGAGLGSGPGACDVGSSVVLGALSPPEPRVRSAPENEQAADAGAADDGGSAEDAGDVNDRGGADDAGTADDTGASDEANAWDDPGERDGAGAAGAGEGDAGGEAGAAVGEEGGAVDLVGEDVWMDDLYLQDLDPESSDPFEETNRGIFGFNRKVERYLLDPISDAYQWIFPDPARDAIYRAFRNLRSPSIFVNDVLQVEPKRAGVTGARFAINTTAGIAGFFDVARRIGLHAHHADFGQTLGRAGVPSGPYLVLPIFGPSTARDAFGDLVDGLFLPQFYVLGPGSNMVLAAGSGLSTRDAAAESLRTLRETSIDFYAALRSAYLMHRHEVIHDPHGASATPSMVP